MLHVSPGCQSPDSAPARVLLLLLLLCIVPHHDSSACCCSAAAAWCVVQPPDMSAVLGGLQLFPAVAAACGAVVALAQDCEEQQRAFTSHPDVLPALFRLLGVDNPATATQTAR